MEDSQIIFHLPWRIRISIFYIILWLPLISILPSELWASDEFKIYIVAFIFISILVPILGVWYLSIMKISSKGISLYHVNNLVWSDVVDANTTKSFGIKTIHIKRKKGMSWSLPLYFVGNNTIKEALLQYAPKDNALYNVASELPSA